jgi:hypothetical protein
LAEVAEINVVKDPNSAKVGSVPIMVFSDDPIRQIIRISVASAHKAVAWGRGVLVHLKKLFRLARPKALDSVVVSMHREGVRSAERVV